MLRFMQNPISRIKEIIAQHDYEKGNLHFDSGEYETAIVHYKKALKWDPTNTTSLTNMANAWVCLAKYEEAIKCYRELLLFDPQHNDAINQLAFIALNKGNFKEAINFCNQQIESKVINDLTYINLAAIYSWMEDYVKASEFYDKVQSDRWNWLVFYNHGFISLYNNKNAQLALEYFEASLDKKDNHPLPLLGKALALLYQGEKENAEIFFKQIELLFQKKPEEINLIIMVCCIAGKVCRNFEDFDRGQMYLHQALQIKSDHGLAKDELEKLLALKSKHNLAKDQRKKLESSYSMPNINFSVENFQNKKTEIIDLNYAYHDQDLSDYQRVVVENELGGWLSPRHQFVIKGNNEGLFKENNRLYLVAVTPAVNTISKSDTQLLPVDYFFNKCHQPGHLIANLLQNIIDQNLLTNLEQNDHSLLKQQLLELLEQQTTDLDTIERIITELSKSQFDLTSLKNIISKLNLQEKKVDVLDEIMPLLAENNGNAKILFAFNNRNQFHWLLGEVKIHKNISTYTVEVYAHDPMGEGQMSSENFHTLKNSLIDRIKSIDSCAEIEVSNCLSPYKRRQAKDDNVSCGPIVARDMIKRIQDETLDCETPYSVGAKELRESHITQIKKYLPESDPTRQAFLKRNHVHDRIAVQKSKDGTVKNKISFFPEKTLNSSELPQEKVKSNFDEAFNPAILHPF